MTGEEAYKALSPKHRAVVDLVSPTTTVQEAYEQVYKCSPASAKRASVRLMSGNVPFGLAVESRKKEVAERVLERSTFDLETLLDRVAEMVTAKSGKKLEIGEDGRVSALPPGQLRPWVETGLKYFVSPLAPGQGREGQVRQEKLLPASLSREDVDELFAKARETGALPGLARPEDNDESVLVVEPEQEDKAPVIQHPALVAVGGGR